MTQTDTKKPSTAEQPVYNSVQFIGRVGKEPQQAAPLAPVCFDLAVWQGKDKEPMWLTVKCWDELGTTVLSEGFCKGTKLTVTGKLTCEKYNNKRMYAVVASAVELIERSKKP